MMAALWKEFYIISNYEYERGPLNDARAKTLRIPLQADHSG